MNFEQGKYYHLYNRSNNEELVFKTKENYSFFLQKYSDYLSEFVSTIAYCLMPTHFHFLVKILTPDEKKLQQAIGLLLSSYTKAINKRFTRHGALFQPHTKAKEIYDERYLFTLISYVHQNPIRSKKVEKMENWSYSSYPIIIEKAEKSLIDVDFYNQYFHSSDEFRKYSNEIVKNVRKEFWV